jgi:hypothetical protein
MLIKLDTSKLPEGSDLGGKLLEISEQLKNFGVDVSITSEELLGITHAKKMIDRYGISALITMQALNEDVIKENTSTDSIISIYHSVFKKVADKSEKRIIVVDPYFFPEEHDSDYHDLIMSVISYFDSIGDICVVTHPGYNRNLAQIIKNDVDRQFSTCLNIKTTKKFHDRFWIFDKDRGIFSGSSLNSIGKKIALIDKLRKNDCIEIYELLLAKNLI